MTAKDHSSATSSPIEAYRLLEHPPGRELLDVVALAAHICGVSMASINVLTEHEQHQVAAVGFEGAVCAREDSMCSRILDEPAPVLVPDARCDERFTDSPFVTGELGEVRFYAAHKLVSPDGFTVGTLCAFDHRPHVVDESQAVALATLAARVVDYLELSLRTRELTASLESMEAMKAQLEESNSRLLSFAGQVSHDLKTPLTSVSMSLTMIRDQLVRGTETSADALWLLERAIRGSARMAALIDDVLDFAKLGGRLHEVEVDLGRVVTDVLVDLGGDLSGSTLRIGELPVVRGDEVQLRAVLQNLVSNAAKFRDVERPSTIAVSASRVDDLWCLEVSDNGRGIAEADRDRIFDPLTRLDASVEGSGIGLATCRRVVEAHDGRIGMEKGPDGIGTTFWIELPA